MKSILRKKEIIEELNAILQMLKRSQSARPGRDDINQAMQLIAALIEKLEEN